MPVGIDDLAIYIPKLYVDYKDFAKARGIDPQKLEYGIGIKKMALVDTNQDPACMAANACLKLMERNHLHPEDIGRMYIATESGLDESKAMNSFVIGMLEQVYRRIPLNTRAELNANLPALADPMLYMITQIG